VTTSLINSELDADRMSKRMIKWKIGVKMNVLFMTIAYPKEGENNIYTDLIQEFVKNGHDLYIACSNERRNNQHTVVNVERNINVLRIRTGNITGQVNIIEKGISTVSLEKMFIRAINSYFPKIHFDLVLYSTPPITFAATVKYLKKRDKAKTYLILKDIFPQNAVDMGMIRSNSLLHRYFTWKENKLYTISDYIGCMSQANVDYIVKNNPKVSNDKLEICPNSISPKLLTRGDIQSIRSKYEIPPNSTTFIYGGNLGKPQGIEFVVECLKKNNNKNDRFFIVCGKGKDYSKLEEFCLKEKPDNIILINGLPKKEYDDLVKICDVGLIFLDHRFTIPNFPSRILSYMEYGMPVLASTDCNTDIGKVIKQGSFGWWCESNDSEKYTELIDSICKNKKLVNEYGINAKKYLEDNYTAEISYNTIIKHFTVFDGGIR